MAGGLLFAAWRAVDEGTGIRIFWLVCALLNGIAAAHMVASEFEYAWQLAPSETAIERNYRR